MEGEIGTFSKDLLQFVTFVLSTLFTNGFMQSAEGGEMNTTLKEIANGASSDSQGLFAGLPHPGSHGGNLWGHLSSGFPFGKEKRINGS